MDYARNKSVNRYEILEKFEAGIELLGYEVKSIKNGKVSITTGYIKPQKSGLFLIGITIPPYQVKNTPQDYNSERSRRLLLTKKEIKKIIGKLNEKGLTLIPVRLYNKNTKIKAEIALVRGLKKYDVREKLKRKEFERIKQRTLKSI